MKKKKPIKTPDGRIEQRVCSNCKEEAGTMYVSFGKDYCEKCSPYLKDKVGK